MKWQPIETAPKDGTLILGYDPTASEDTSVYLVRWEDDAELDRKTGDLVGRWVDCLSFHCEITEWIPIPKGPNPPDKNEKTVSEIGEYLKFPEGSVLICEDVRPPYNFTVGWKYTVEWVNGDFSFVIDENDMPNSGYDAKFSFVEGPKLEGTAKVLDKEGIDTGIRLPVTYRERVKTEREVYDVEVSNE